MTTWQERSYISKKNTFSNKQVDFIKEITSRFSNKTKNSKIFAQKHRMVLADSKAASGYRDSVKEMFYPIVGQLSYGSSMEDIDGNKYIDVTMGYGSNFLGNNPNCVTQALSDEIVNGIALGVRSQYAGEVASLISKFTAHDRIVFCNTGTEAVMTAIRLARGKSGKSKIAIFSGSYHGHSDLTYCKISSKNINPKIIPSLGIPNNMQDNLLVLKYGSEDSLLQIDINANNLAAVLVEPIQAKNPTFNPTEFLKKLRKLTKDKNIALIFDEMITGFRAHQAGVQGLLGIQADISTYGKAVGGGLPMGVVAGNSSYLNYIDGGYWEYNDHSSPSNPKVFFGGTYCQHPLSLRASKAVLEYMQEAGPDLQTNLNKLTSDFCKTLNNFFIDEQVPIKIVYFSSMFRWQMPTELDILYYLLVNKGIYICEWRNCFLSTAHTDEDIKKIIDVIKNSIHELKNAGFIEDINHQMS